MNIRIEEYNSINPNKKRKQTENSKNNNKALGTCGMVTKTQHLGTFPSIPVAKTPHFTTGGEGSISGGRIRAHMPCSQKISNILKS